MPTWTASLAVGNALIDRQHQELFRRADRLLVAMREGRSAAEVAPLLQFLAEYCAEHFAAEAALMRGRSYPQLAEHLALHAEFERSFGEIVARFHRKGPSPTVTLALQQLVCDWLVKHVGAADRQLATFLAAPERGTA